MAGLSVITVIYRNIYLEQTLMLMSMSSLSLPLPMMFIPLYLIANALHTTVQMGIYLCINRLGGMYNPAHGVGYSQPITCRPGAHHAVDMI